MSFATKPIASAIQDARIVVKMLPFFFFCKPGGARGFRDSGFRMCLSTIDLADIILQG